ncbi:MAG: hypothetical protein KAY24_16460 [Candidatus Eisenbacteria sp.]|nr:hypothetical protein [Candidatus Eisenbacteria bacterium]
MCASLLEEWPATDLLGVGPDDFGVEFAKVGGAVRWRAEVPVAITGECPIGQLDDVPINTGVDRLLDRGGSPPVPSGLTT